MKDFVETERLILSRFIFEDGSLFHQMQKKHPHSSSEALAYLIKNNKEVINGIFGWWADIASPYSAGYHIRMDEHLWRHKKQFQYYLYDKKTEKCIGVFCSLINENKADVLVWLSKEAQRNGFAVEAAKSFEKELFLTAGVDAIQYRCYRHNQNKQRVAAFLKILNYPSPIEGEKAFIWIKTKENFLSTVQTLEKKLITRQVTPNSFFAKMRLAFGWGRVN